MFMGRGGTGKPPVRADLDDVDLSTTMTLMLKLMRDNLKHLTWVLGLVVFTFVFAVFADYGGQGRWFGGSTGNWAAMVNGEPISIRAFQDQARRVDAYYRQLLGTAYSTQRANLSIGQQAIGQLVQNRVIFAHAHSLGLIATPEEIRDAIVHDPSLQGENGFIGIDRYKNVLQSFGRIPADYERSVGDQVLLRKWIEVVTADIVASDEQVEKAIRRRDERADLTFARISRTDFADQVKISDGDIENYFKAHQDDYRRGEGRSFEIVVLDRLHEQRDLTVPESDVRAEYEASLQSRFAVPEQRRASHILIKTLPDMTGDQIAAARTRAQNALDRIRGGEDFAAVAREVSEDASATNGGDLGFFGRGVMTPTFEQTVWQLGKIGDVSNLVQTEFGFHIIKLTGKRDRRIKPFEEVRDEIEKEVAFRRAGEQVAERAQALYDLVKDQPGSFRDEIARQSRVVTETGPIYPGDPVPGLGANPEVERALFALNQGEISEPIAIARGFLLARYVEPHAGGAPPLDEIRERVESDLRAARADEMARRLVDQALADPEGRDLATLGKALGFDTEEVTDVTRGTPIGRLGRQPEIEAAVFDADPGSIHGPFDVGGDRVLFYVETRNTLTADEIAERADAMREQLMVARRQQAVTAVTRELVKAADIRYNAEVIRSADGSSAAPTPASTS
ncbi:MAG: peptidylprolyl isomerase [Rhodospirillales bacterium]